MKTTSNEQLDNIIRAIEPIDNEYVSKSFQKWDSLCKPLRGLGWLEEAVAKMAGIYRTIEPQPNKRALLIMGADNGVVAEGVTQTDSSVTMQVLENIGDMKSTACVMGRLANCDVFPINIGALTDGKNHRIHNCVVRYGTDNITKGPAMSREECLKAILVGIDSVSRVVKDGYNVILSGEMGIGNTTTSAACAAVIMSLPAKVVTGRGAGLSDEGLMRKITAIEKAIELNRPNLADPIDIISKVGGLDIAGMVGCFVGAAYHKVPIIIDGFISQVAANLADMLCSDIKGYMLPSHCSKEPGSMLLMERLEMSAPINANMHLGEGTGAVMALSFIDQALNVYYNMATWEEGKVEAYISQSQL